MNGLEELAAHVENMFRIKCQYVCNKPVLFTDSAAAIHVYRITQEAVNNAIKHGKAKHVVITLDRAGDSVSIMVEDDGVGFPRVLPERRGMGLQIMQYRASLIGANISIRRGPAGGTTVTFTFHHPSSAQENIHHETIAQDER